MSEEHRNLILAIVLSMLILFLFHFFYEVPRIEQEQAAAERQQQLSGQQVATGGDAMTPDASMVPQAPGSESAITGPATSALATRQKIDAAIEAGDRIRIDTPRLRGSVALTGARFDDLTLLDYRVDPDPESPQIVLLAPAGSPRPYYAEFGWVSSGSGLKLPNHDTRWQADADQLVPGQPVTLSWDNGAGLVFEQVLTVDENYLFTVTQRVRNTGDAAATLLPYGLVSRHGTPETLGFYILHEGPLGVFDGTLEEYDYSDLQEAGTITHQARGGWIGITDKYWLASLLPSQETTQTARFVHSLGTDGRDRYQVDLLNPQVTLNPDGSSTETTTRLFAGAKEVTLFDRYSEELGIENLDLAIDFGWFYFLTKPFFYALYYLNLMFGNFGVAIIIMTLIIKAIFYPLADKSYRSMSKMKKLQPEMVKLKERFGNDRQRMNEEMMALYKREGANPVSGCLPILIQIPVFFALYKVLFVSIEMRHAPFFGWIQDLSAPDPTNVFTLFGLLPIDMPSFLHIGIWPLIMGSSMFLQQRLNPAPPDPTQARIFMMLPIVFTFLLANFPAGLVIYWTCNNVLSIAQQWSIMKRMGVK